LSEDEPALSRLNVAVTALLVFAITIVGCTASFALWLRDLSTPQVDVLGSGNRLSLLVTDGPARLLLATGDDPDQFNNALARFRPIFARRVDVLLMAGANRTLNVPVAANQDPYVRESFALGPIPHSPESEALGRFSTFQTSQAITLGPNVTVMVETAYPMGANPAEEFPAWRATIARAESRIVVVSDGDAAALFPPADPAAVLVVAGNDPAEAWETQPALALVTTSDAISGPAMRETFADASRSPEWTVRVFPGEALRLRFVDGGVAIPSDAARKVEGTPVAATVTP
jgi:hypothetical protein